MNKFKNGINIYNNIYGVGYSNKYTTTKLNEYIKNNFDLQYLKNVVGDVKFNLTYRGLTISFVVDDYTIHLGFKISGTSYKKVYYIELENGKLLKFCNIHKHFYPKLEKDADEFEIKFHNMMEYEPYNELFLSDTLLRLYTIDTAYLSEAYENNKLDDFNNGVHIDNSILLEYNITKNDYMKIISLIKRLGLVNKYTSKNIDKMPECYINNFNNFVNFILLDDQGVVVRKNK